jgi:hypothetical protein
MSRRAGGRKKKKNLILNMLLINAEECGICAASKFFNYRVVVVDLEFLSSLIRTAIRDFNCMQ